MGTPARPAFFAEHAARPAGRVLTWGDDGDLGIDDAHCTRRSSRGRRCRTWWRSTACSTSPGRAPRRRSTMTSFEPMLYRAGSCTRSSRPRRVAVLQPVLRPGPAAQIGELPTNIDSACARATSMPGRAGPGFRRGLESYLTRCRTPGPISTSGPHGGGREPGLNGTSPPSQPSRSCGPETGLPVSPPERSTCFVPTSSAGTGAPPASYAGILHRPSPTSRRAGCGRAAAEEPVGRHMMVPPSAPAAPVRGDAVGRA